MTYIRRQPWRPRSPWLGARAGARRRGFRQDGLMAVPDVMQESDAAIVVTGEAADDTVLAVDVAEPATQHAIPARIDISGLQAISALAPQRFSQAAVDGDFPSVGWHAFGESGDEEHYLFRHSA